MTLGGRAEWTHGGVQYPLVAATTASLLADADPALSLALDYFATAMNLHFGARLKAQALLEGIKINNAVATKLAIEPTPAVLADNFLFPMFTLYRATVSTREHTTVWDKDVGEWTFAYVLPLMTPRQIAKISPILRSVERSLAHSTRQGMEPSYKGGAHIWTLAGLQSIKMKDVRYEPYASIDQENGVYRAVAGTIEVVERDMTTSGAFERFDGSNVGIDHVSSDGVVDDVVLASVFAPPTFALVSPNNGSKGGGTLLVLTGEGFRAPMQLRVDTTLVDVTVLSLTSATAVTPPHVAIPTFMADLTLIAFDGQSARLPASFTFTTP